MDKIKSVFVWRGLVRLSATTDAKEVPDRPFHNLEASKSVTDLHRIRPSPDFEALKLKNGRSGSRLFKRLLKGNLKLGFLVFLGTRVPLNQPEWTI